MKHEFPDDGLRHDLTDNGVNCMCDPVVDWDNNTVQHNDMRPIYDYTKQLFIEAEYIRLKESGLGNIVETDRETELAERELQAEYDKITGELDEYINKIGRRARRLRKIKTYMNKKQKILTAVALAVFSAIILLHYVNHSWGYGLGLLYFSSHGLIKDVRMPLFVLAVFYTGLFFLLAKKR
jgi:hypothetical protein